MNRWMIATVALAALCAVEGVWALGPALSGEARAQVPGDDVEHVETSTRRLCKLFQTDLQHGAVLETADRTTEIGQWVGEQEDAGWRLHDLDFEVGQKPTGYPQGYVQVCLTAG